MWKSSQVFLIAAIRNPKSEEVSRGFIVGAIPVDKREKLLGEPIWGTGLAGFLLFQLLEKNEQVLSLAVHKILAPTCF